MAEDIKVDAVEVIIDSIIAANRSNQPENELYQLRNPIGLRWYDTRVDGKFPYREFSGLCNGYRAAVFDIKVKLKGKSVHRLKPTDCLENLITLYDVTDYKTCVSFLRRALKDNTITVKTKLERFIK